MSNVSKALWFIKPVKANFSIIQKPMERFEKLLDCFLYDFNVDLQISFKDSKLPQIYQKEHQCFSFSIDLRHQPFSYIYLILLKKSTKNVRIGHFVMKLRLLLKLSVLKIVLCNKKDVWNFCLFLCIVYQTTYVWLPGG